VGSVHCPKGDSADVDHTSGRGALSDGAPRDGDDGGDSGGGSPDDGGGDLGEGLPGDEDEFHLSKLLFLGLLDPSKPAPVLRAPLRHHDFLTCTSPATPHFFFARRDLFKAPNPPLPHFSGTFSKT